MLRSLCTALVVSLVGTGATVVVLGRLGLYDVPGERSSHTGPTLRGGGVGPMLALVAGLLVADAGGDAVAVLVAAALVFGLVGLADDLAGGSPVLLRLALQVTAALLLAGGWVVDQRWSSGEAAALALGLLAAAWVVGYVNAFNFMDGVDGISGLHAIVLGVVAAIVGAHEDLILLEVAGAALAGAGAGFLPWNLPVARIFLGDVGSYALGAWYAVLVVVGLQAGAPPVALLAPAAVYAADTAVTLARRLRRGADWRASHHEHTYQQLNDLGWSHLATALTVTAATSCCALAGLLTLTSWSGAPALAAVIVVAVVAGYLSLPNLVENRAGRVRAGGGATRPAPPA